MEQTSHTKKILAEYDDEGIFVYQAFKPSIVEAALEHGTFSKGFSMDRMTWIKPSFGWMLYRSNYATSHRQQAILKIKLTHEGFLTILNESVATSYNESMYATEIEWRDALKHSAVRYQWDPDRTVHLHRLERRAIQLGIRGWVVEHYVHKWIIGLQDVTALAHALQYAIQNRHSTLPEVPELREYKVGEALQQRLGM